MSEQKLPKMRVKLGELNELQFSLSIKGSTSDPSSTKPRIRFLVSEIGNEEGITYSFPVADFEEGILKVNIPPLQNVFDAKKEYLGKIEVRLGNRWFEPSQVILLFEQDIKIESEPLVEETTKKEHPYQDNVLLDILFSPRESSTIKEVKHAPVEASTVNSSDIATSVIQTKTAPQIQSKSFSDILSKPLPVSLLAAKEKNKTKSQLKQMITEAWTALEQEEQI